MTDLTDEQAQKLFAELSNATRENDTLKVSELMKTEASEEEAPVEEKPTDPPAEEEKSEESPNEEEKKEEEQAPSDEKKTEQTEQKKEEKPEPTELDKLREQLEKVQKENHSLRSQAGRVPHVQRRLQELDKKLEEIEKQRTSPSSQPFTKIQPKIAKLLEGIKEDDSELADAIAAAIEEATNGIAEEVHTARRDNIKLLRDGELTAYRQAEAHRLLEMYPNAGEVFSSPSWSSWKKEQSEGILRLAESDSADEVDKAFKMYAEDMLTKYPHLAPKDEAAKPVEAPVKKEESEQAQKVEAERLRKKQTAAPAGSSSAPGKVGLPDDPDALFRKFSEEIRKQRTG